MLKNILSMKVAVWLLFLFGAVIGAATFIENDYGTQTAQALFYSSRWFEVFLFYFIIVLIYNIFKFKSYKVKKWSVFLFHMSFLVIAIGAAITRYVGYEGIMHIREGQSSNTMVSNVKILQLDVLGAEEKEYFETPMILSSMTENTFSKTMTVGDKEVHFELMRYLPAAQKVLIPDPNGKMFLELKVANGKGGSSDVRLTEGEHYDAGTFMLAFNHAAHGESTKPLFNISSKDGKLEVESNFPMNTLSMITREEANLTKGVNAFEMKKLYQFGENAVVLREAHEKSIIAYNSASLKTKAGKPEMLTLKVSSGEESKEVDLFAHTGNKGEVNELSINGVDVAITLGAKVIKLPFSLKLIDFELKRYPGSNSPSSYASDVELTDKEAGIESMPYKIYMNHVLDHKSYRFFQSSYDQDEKGTILSVNHDPGTLPTYLGYILLTLGMIWNIFSREGRFQKLLRGAKKLQGLSAVVALLFALSVSTPLQAASLPKLDENISKIINTYDKEGIERFSKLLTQDVGGRMKPIDTLAHEIVSKLTGKTSIYGIEPSALFLGMTVEPNLYQKIVMLKVDHTRIAEELGLDKGAKYAAFTDFFTKDGAYKLSKQVSESVRKKPLDKNKYDNELIKVDERLNIAYMVYTGALLKIYPVPNDVNNKWVSPEEAIKTFPKDIGNMVRMMTMHLFTGVSDYQKNGNSKTLQDGLKLVELYQKKFGSEVLLSTEQVDMEVKYNKLGLLSKLVPLYLLVGILLLLVAFAHVIKPTFSMKWIMKVAWSLTIVGFIVHVVGMGMRWYISGHAPWSNSYESIVFIAASTVLAGLVFARKSPFTLAAAVLLGGITMAVAHMSFINPEITNLVPVLKSYWLMIHVATIIAGDGFLGLGSILSLLVLILFILKREGKENIDRSIKELTNIAEMSLIVGLFLMTIGNFLGGVWANESWGRYWGWDAKETWAAVTILVYATVLHLRFIPKLNNPFAFNVASLWAYSTVIMTYFGVNYYLSGLHSYAAGAPIPLPSWVIPSVIALFVLTLIAAKSWKNIKIALIVLSPLIIWVAGLILMLKV